jgi:hypothetical protein
MDNIFATIAKNHRVSADSVQQAVHDRRLEVDLAVIFSFIVVYYGTVGRAVSHWLVAKPVSRMPLGLVTGPLRSSQIDLLVGESRPVRILMIALAVVILSILGVMLGEIWSGFFEVVRVGNGHLGFRALRIPWGQHRLAIFLAMLSISGCLMSVRYRRT